MNEYVMARLAADRSQRLLGEAAQARLARSGRATQPVRRATDGGRGVRGHLALLLGRSHA